MAGLAAVTLLNCCDALFSLADGYGLPPVWRSFPLCSARFCGPQPAAAPLDCIARLVAHKRDVTSCSLHMRVKRVQPAGHLSHHNLPVLSCAPQCSAQCQQPPRQSALCAAGGGGVDHRLDLLDGGDRDAAHLSVLADGMLAGGQVHAVRPARGGCVHAQCTGLAGGRQPGQEAAPSAASAFLLELATPAAVRRAAAARPAPGTGGSSPAPPRSALPPPLPACCPGHAQLLPPAGMTRLSATR